MKLIKSKPILLVLNAVIVAIMAFTILGPAAALANGNTAPVANDDTYSTNEDTALVVDAAAGVLFNDTDIEGNILTAIKVSEPASGSVVLDSDGAFTYTPNADFNGSDSFTYKANDGAADSNIATVTITITPVNDAPVAVNDSYTTPEDTALVVDAAAGVLFNDTDIEGNILTAIKMTEPANGSVVLDSDGAFTYSPNADFNGSDSFTYKANDGAADSNIATVSIAVGVVNDAPVAVDDAYSVEKNETLTIDAPGVLGNDTDVDGDPLTADLQVDVSNGTLALATDGSFTYTPNAGFTGTDTFTYVANDGELDSNIATVNITVEEREPGGNQIPPGQLVRRGLSGPIESIVGNVLDTSDDMLFLMISTNFGLVQVYVPDDLVPDSLVPQGGFEVGQRVVVKLAPENMDEVADEETDVYRVAEAEAIKVVPVKASRSHEWGDEEIAIVQETESGKQFKGLLLHREKIQERLEAFIGEAEGSGDEALLEKLQKRLEKQEQKIEKLQQRFNNSAQSSNNNDDEDQNPGQGKGKDNDNGKGNGKGKNK